MEVTAMLPHPEIVSNLNRMHTQSLHAEAARRRLIASCHRSAPAPATSEAGGAGEAGGAVAARRVRRSPRRLGLALARGILATLCGTCLVLLAVAGDGGATPPAGWPFRVTGAAAAEVPAGTLAVAA